ALNDNDIIITNGKVGAVLAVGTRNPWGYPAGSVLDAGTVTTKQANRDTVWSVELLMNGWDSWAPSNCGVVTFDLVKYNFQTKAEDAAGINAVKVTRVYDIKGTKFDVNTYYSAGAGNSYLYMFDKLKNTSGKETASMSNRFAMTNKGDDGGSMYTDKAKQSAGSYGVSTTGSTYSTTLMVPGTSTSSANIQHPFTKIGGAVGYKELRFNQTWKENEEMTYDEYIIISDEPSTKVANDFSMAYNKITDKTTVSGTLEGIDTAKNSAIVVKKGNTIYGWYDVAKDGKSYTLDIPKAASVENRSAEAEEYTVYLEHQGRAAGDAVVIDNSKAADTCNLKVGAAKADITINLKDKAGNPVWGKVEFLGEYPTVRYIGNSVFQAAEKGVIKAQVNSITDFQATVFGEGYNFFSAPVSITGTDVKNGVVDVTIDMVNKLPEEWLAADVHHHTNKNDAFALPKDVVLSNLASGLDVVMTTDHDFTTNNFETNQFIANINKDTKEINGHIPSEEISTSWAHFNVIPQTAESYDYFMDKNKENHNMNQFDKLQNFVDQTHKVGASITANHPWYSYGLFYAQDNDAIYGGYSDDYDNIEINACCSDNENIKTINTTTDLWSSYASGKTNKTYGDVKKAHYLVSGSDTHDVLYPGVKNDKGTTSVVTYATGKGRTVAYTGNVSKKDLKDTGLAYANSVANGHSYITLGPVLNLDKTPGNTYTVAGNFTTKIGVQSLSGIKDIVVLSSFGKDTYAYDGKTDDISANKQYTINNVYAVYTAQELMKDVKNDTVSLNVPIKSGEKGWVAFMFVDANDYHMYALTNPYWVKQTSKLYPDTAHWGIDAINALTDRGAITGYEDGTFRPDNQISRAEFAAIVARLDNFAPKAEFKDLAFTDVPENQWYYGYIMELTKAGIINGYEDKTFKPDALITRSEIASMIAKTAGWDKGYKINEKLSFTDISDNWAKSYIQYLADKDLIKGYEDKTFRPDNNATRAE
ncbi:MAG: S-layer homology domain-containing protein, partial [Oscillospiraceae bacterium]